MKTIQQQIAVMQHFANGGEVEYKELYLNEQYKTIENENMTLWNWADFDYRIKEQKKTVTIEKWLFEKEGREGLWVLEGDYFYFLTLESVYKKVKLLETYEVEI